MIELTDSGSDDGVDKDVVIVAVDNEDSVEYVPANKVGKQVCRDELTVKLQEDPVVKVVKEEVKVEVATVQHYDANVIVARVEIDHNQFTNVVTAINEQAV